MKVSLARPKVLVAVTGASGAVYALSLLQELASCGGQFEELAVIFTENGRKVWEYELPDTPEIPAGIVEFANADLFAPPASGSAGYTHLVICPCSMATLARVANGIANDLLGRAADVILKERQKLILVTREMPLSLIHLRNMETVTLAGGIVCPASPFFYSGAVSREEIVKTVTEKICNLCGFPNDSFRWGQQK